jgi:metal-dependent amidase/aminoacylase/carboxypeptidase family protein
MQDVFGAKVILALDKPYGGSTDFGNVTHVLPGCHPVFNIEADGLNHTPE